MKRHLTQASVATAAVVALLLLGMTATFGARTASSPVQIRPIEDFLDAQGTCANGIAPPYHSLAWIDPETQLFIAVDYAGLVEEWIEEESGGAITLGTEIEGKVIERPLPDGRAEVTVLLHTRNAFTVVTPFVGGDPPFGDALFGHHAWDVVAGADAALGECMLKWVFINDAPGAPLPDVLVEFIPGPPAHEPIMLFFEAHAEGTLREGFGVPDGTPGRAQTTQVGLFRNAGKGPKEEDVYPAEHIKLTVLGR